MRFPRYWSKVEHDNISVWGWSDHSQSDAKSRGEERAEKLAQLLAQGPLPKSSYGYADKPLREEIIRQLPEHSSTPSALVTRNNFGALVLNSAEVMFIDVDAPEVVSSKCAVSWISKLFGGSKKEDSSPSLKDEPAALQKAREWAESNPRWGFRAYRTFAGWRFIVTHDLFDPKNVLSEKVFDALEADPLYRRLCKSQESFRARLTPKPWRCLMSGPPSSWPWADKKAEEAFRAWEQRYAKCCEEYSTCHFVTSIGDERVHRDISEIVKIHDHMTRCAEKLPLA